MKPKKTFSVLFALTFCLLLLPSCTRRPSEVWDDAKTSSRHFRNGLYALAGKCPESRQVFSREEFLGWQEQPYSFGCQESEFIGIPQESCNAIVMNDYAISQPIETPGDPGSSIPGIDAFQDPSCVPGLNALFQNIHFEYNSHFVKSDENINRVIQIANYLKSHPRVYLFIEGHCDERGPEAYNLALGARRSNAVRGMLLEQGVNPDHVFTISYGKERPLVFGTNEASWAQNRRAEFKVYNK